MPDSLTQLTNHKLPLNRAIISDILLWLALALLVAYGIYFFGIAWPAKRGETITLQFSSANEISKGAPLRLMGTDIGFVSNVRIRNDFVEVTLQTYPKTLKIPSGSSFNILFTGLGGAKSIEVEPPDMPEPYVNGHPVYHVQDPVTMRETLNASIDVTQALQKGAENISDFFGKKKPVEELQYNIREVHALSASALNNTGILNQVILDIHQQVHDSSQPAIGTLSELSPGLAYAASVTNPTTARPEVQRFFQSLHKFSEVLSGRGETALGTVAMQKRLTQINQINSQINSGITSLNGKFTTGSMSLWAQRNADNLSRISDSLDQAVVLSSRDYSPTLQKAQTHIRAFNRQLEQLNQQSSQQTPAQPPSKQ